VLDRRQMHRVVRALVFNAGLGFALAGCGGSGSETPPPLEPRPEEIERAREGSPTQEGAASSSGGAESSAGNGGQAPMSEPSPGPAVPPSNF
jgi:hypothetical protein